MTRFTLVIACSLAALAMGCEPSVKVGGAPVGGGQGGPSTMGNGTANGTGQAIDGGVDGGEGEDVGSPMLEYDDDRFVESDQNRDPFRSFQRMFKARPVQVQQRTVIMPNVSIDEMRLIAIITGGGRPRAMLVDATGVGYTVKPRDYLGRSEVVQPGGEESMPVTLNWRVERINQGEVILTREDPTGPDRPPLTRTIVLHDDDSSQGVPGAITIADEEEAAAQSRALQ